jgi:hypothetical protein
MFKPGDILRPTPADKAYIRMELCEVISVDDDTMDQICKVQAILPVERIQDDLEGYYCGRFILVHRPK